MNAALWFLLGGFVGFDIALAYAWLSARKANRSGIRRVGFYTGSSDASSPVLIFDHTKKRPR